MEGFGLFNLLKTFLDSERKTEENADVSAVDNAPNVAPSTTENVSENESEKPNACAEFLARHDALSKRVKK